MRLFGWASGLLAAALFGASASAAVISLDRTQIDRATNQFINITVSGTEELGGALIFLQIGDGGTYNSGTDTTPAFASFSGNSARTGSIFNVPADVPPAFVITAGGQQVRFIDITGPANEVPDGEGGYDNEILPVVANGNLARITLDASALPANQNSFTLRILDVAPNNREGQDVRNTQLLVMQPPDQNGARHSVEVDPQLDPNVFDSNGVAVITVPPVPEPASLGLLALGGLLLVRRRA